MSGPDPKPLPFELDVIPSASAMNRNHNTNGVGTESIENTTTSSTDQKSRSPSICSSFTMKSSSSRSESSGSSKSLRRSLKRKSEPIRRFESESRALRRRLSERHHFDISECVSTNYRLESAEYHRFRAPSNNKRRRISDVPDLFALEHHSGYRLQAAAPLIDPQRLKRQGLEHFAVPSQDRDLYDKIKEVVQAQNVVVAFTERGLAAAFHRRDLRLLCYLNTSKDETVQSIFHNDLDDSFVVCSAFKGDILRTRSIRIRALELQRYRGVPIFERENVSWPGWLEFDESRHRVLTYNHQTRLYRLWDLEDYSMIYQFARFDPNGHRAPIEDVMLHCNAFATYKRSDGLIQNQRIHRDKKVLFSMRSFDSKVITKQFYIAMDIGDDTKMTETEDGLQPMFSFMEYDVGFLYVIKEGTSILHVYDSRRCTDSATAAVLVHSYDVSCSYLFLKRIRRLLVHQSDDSGSCKYGLLDLVTAGEAILEENEDEKVMMNRDSIMTMTRDQSKIIYYYQWTTKEEIDRAKEESDRLNAGRHPQEPQYRKQPQKWGIIKIKSLETGYPLGSITSDGERKLSPRWCLSAVENEKRAEIEVEKDPLKHVSVICYNERHNEIYTGNWSGNRAHRKFFLYLWA